MTDNKSINASDGLENDIIGADDGCDRHNCYKFRMGCNEYPCYKLNNTLSSGITSQETLETKVQ
jgi:hypothetical protein